MEASPGVMQRIIAPESPQQPDVERLLLAADRRSASLYPQQSRFGATAATLLAQAAYFCVVRLDGRATGCGGFVVDGRGGAELKRIYVDAAVRGTGLGRLILQTLEAAARRRGVQVMRLETGLMSVEAIGLYTRFGYARRDAFAPYPPDPLSVFMEKRIGFGQAGAQAPSPAA